LKKVLLKKVIEESTYIYLLGVLIINNYYCVITEIWIMNLCLFSRQRGSRCVFLQKLLTSFLFPRQKGAQTRGCLNQPSILVSILIELFSNYIIS